MCTAYFKHRKKISSAYRRYRWNETFIDESNSCKMFSLPKLLKGGYGGIGGFKDLVLCQT